MEADRSRRARRPYPRVARVNALLHEVLAEQLERAADTDDRLGMATITGVECAPDLKTAVVYLSSIGDELAVALEEHRRELQANVGREVTMKRVPTLRFLADPAVAYGGRIEAALRRAREHDEQR